MSISDSFNTKMNEDDSELSTDLTIESSFIKINIENLCRICGLATESIVDIFSFESPDIELMQQIEFHLHITIDQYDALPRKICRICLNKLLDFHELFVLCANTKTRFENMLKESIDIVINGDEPTDNPNSNEVLDYLDTSNFSNLDMMTELSENLPIQMEQVEATVKSNYEINSLTTSPTNDQMEQYSCTECNEILSTQSALDTHKNIHEKLECRICRRTFKKEEYLKEHSQIHTENSFRFNCPICSIPFRKKYNMEVHVSSHVEDNPCHVCCSSFLSKSALLRHKTIHSEAENLYYHRTVKCDECTDEDVLFESKLSLYMHKKERHCKNYTPFSCSICKKVFKSDAILQTHKKVHSCNLICDICSKQFNNERKLENHKRMHTEDRPFKCDMCEQSFRYQSNLHQHKLSHLNQRPFKCIYCSVAFLRASTLRAHARIHLAEKPYKCDHCSKSFIQKNILTRHLQSKHKKCVYCGLFIGNKNDFCSFSKTMMHNVEAIDQITTMTVSQSK